jgi:hypothetical protein
MAFLHGTRRYRVKFDGKSANNMKNISLASDIDEYA